MSTQQNRAGLWKKIGCEHSKNSPKQVYSLHPKQNQEINLKKIHLSEAKADLEISFNQLKDFNDIMANFDFSQILNSKDDQYSQVNPGHEVIGSNNRGIKIDSSDKQNYQQKNFKQYFSESYKQQLRQIIAQKLKQHVSCLTTALLQIKNQLLQFQKNIRSQIQTYLLTLQTLQHPFAQMRQKNEQLILQNSKKQIHNQVIIKEIQDKRNIINILQEQNFTLTQQKFNLLNDLQFSKEETQKLKQSNNHSKMKNNQLFEIVGDLRKQLVLKESNKKQQALLDSNSTKSKIAEIQINTKPRRYKSILVNSQKKQSPERFSQNQFITIENQSLNSLAKLISKSSCEDKLKISATKQLISSERLSGCQIMRQKRFQNRDFVKNQGYISTIQNIPILENSLKKKCMKSSEINQDGYRISSSMKALTIIEKRINDMQKQIKQELNEVKQMIP